MSNEADVHETDGFTVELRIYWLADVDLGGLGGDEAYEACPLLRTVTQPNEYRPPGDETIVAYRPDRCHG